LKLHKTGLTKHCWHWPGKCARTCDFGVTGKAKNVWTMQDMATTQPIPVRKRGGRGLATGVAVLVIAALGGAAWIGWQHGWVRVDGLLQSPAPSAEPSVESSAAVAAANLVATDSAIAAATAKVAALEQRLADLNQQAIAASGQASHAEALLIAFAARRAVERGQALGYLENQLRVRFGNTQPNAVDRVVAAGRKPVTLGQLNEEFTALEPRLAGGAQNEGTWDWLSRQVGELFVIRHDDMPSPQPENRIARARLALAGGRVDAAIAEVERLPGKDAAADWLSHARDYAMTQNALDQLETAALAMPVAPPAVAATSAPIAPGAGPNADASAKPAPEPSETP
jgi:hypothetical protein